MKKVTVLPEVFAGEEVVDAVLQAAAEAVPAGKEPPRAEVFRDAGGKVIKVEVNLPYDLAQSDLINARDKVQNNNGVSKARPAGIVITENFDSLTPGDPISDIVVDGFTVHPTPTAETSLTAAASADSYGATGSAVQSDKTTTSPTMQSGSDYIYKHSGDLTFNLALNGFSVVRSYQLKYKIKMKAGTRGDVYSSSQIVAGAVGSGGMELHLAETGSPQKWLLFAVDYGLNNFITEVTALDLTDWIDVDMTFIAGGPVHLVSVAASLDLYASPTSSTTSITDEIKLRMLTIDADAGSTFDMVPMILDDYSLTILDAE